MMATIHTRQMQLTKIHTRKTTPREGKQHQTTKDVVGPDLEKKPKVLQADI
jgi:hypothetical protein